jgi:GT2 family glycosyltransferase
MTSVSAAPPTEIAVAFVIREKFAWALASLQRLYALAGVPFRLYFVDGGYPREVRAALDAFLADKTNVVRIGARRFLYPGEAWNLALARVAEPYVFLLQNDVLIGRGALASLLETARRLDCDGVAPDILDSPGGVPQAHHESSLALAVREREGRLWIEPDPAPEHRDGYRRLHHFELHCLFLRTAVLRAIGPLPPLNVHEHVDLALALWRAGKTVYLDEKARVLFMDCPPLQLRDYECPFYRFRWDLGRARLSQAYVQDKWRMGNLFDAIPFVERQHTALAREKVLTGYASALEADQWPAGISA